MLYAIRDSAGGLFALSDPGVVSVASNGSNSFTTQSQGKHRYIIKQKSDADIAATIEALMIKAPR
jgi:hypothetical protein